MTRITRRTKMHHKTYIHINNKLYHHAVITTEMRPADIKHIIGLM